MTIKINRNPYGYRNLLVYKKADELQSLCTTLTQEFEVGVKVLRGLASAKTLAALADQMNRSARSTKQNITEGWKRNSTKEYYEFLGYAIASNAELEEDATDICKGHYPGLKRIKGVFGEWVERAEKGITREKGAPPVAAQGFGPLSPLKPPPPFRPFSPISDIEKLPFYPLDKTLPPVVQLKLRAKELNFLLEKLQKSLVTKMGSEHTLPVGERMRLAREKIKQDDVWVAGLQKGLRGGKGEDKGEEKGRTP